MDARITAIEGGAPRSTSAGKKEVRPPVMRVSLSPRAGGDPLQPPGGDAWTNYRRGVGFTDAKGEHANQWQDTSFSGEPSWQQPLSGGGSASKNPYARNLESRVGERKTVIIGGFPRDTGKGDIEATMRGIVDGARRRGESDQHVEILHRRPHLFHPQRCHVGLHQARQRN